jgi:hypothetical protein
MQTKFVAEVETERDPRSPLRCRHLPAEGGGASNLKIRVASEEFAIPQRGRCQSPDAAGGRPAWTPALQLEEFSTSGPWGRSFRTRR